MENKKEKIVKNKTLKTTTTKTVKGKEKETIDLKDFVISDIYNDDEKSNTERIQIKNNYEQINREDIVIVDNETSSVLERLKKQEVFNKPKEVTSEEKDIEIANEEVKVDDSVIRYLDTDISIGLTLEQVELRKKENLVNIDTDDKGKSYLEIVLSNIFTFFNMLYFIITIILIWVNEIGSLVFLCAVIPNIIIGLIQEINSKRTVDKLKIMQSPVATVIREEKKLEIPTNEVVLDEIILFTAGKQICCDSIIVDGNIEVNESLLTGEADAIPKGPNAKIFAGSFVSSGTCVARADKVGKDCYIAKMSNEAKKYSAPKSELLKTLKGVIKVISFLLLPVAVLYMLSRIDGDITFKAFFEIEFIKQNIAKVSFIILAMIPAGLFLLTSIALALSVIRLGRNKTLVQQLYCIEMLARVDVLCLDKTGTITDGTMRVCDCVEINNHTDYTIREIIGSMMSSFKETNPTSEALIKYFDVNTVLQPVEVIPFSSKRKFSAVTFADEGTFVIGAPDFVIKDLYEKIASKVLRFSSQGCRVLVLGYLQTKIKADVLPKNVKPLALIVIQDHIRDDAKDTINFFKQNNVDIKVISGDNPETVSKIADRVGVEGANRYINLNGLTDDEIRECVFDYNVFGRVTPSQKKLIVQTLKANGKTVAMTGDGVNDIPALKEADCSIAMASGSEATRYVSHLVLMDSNFSSMPKVVNEGRRVINNIQKTSSLYLSKNLFAFLIAIMYIIIGFISKGNRDQVIFRNIDFPFKPQNLMLIEMIILAFATFFLSIQSNRDIVKGRFLSNVIKQIIPGSLVILLFQMIIFFLQVITLTGDDYLFKQLTFGDNVYLTISSIVTTAVMVRVLYDSCKPFNWFRGFIFGIVCVLITICVSVPYLRNIICLSFENFGDAEWLLLIILLLGLNPLMALVKYFLRFIHVIPKEV